MTKQQPPPSRELEFMYSPTQAVQATERTVKDRYNLKLTLTLPIPSANNVIEPFSRGLSFMQGRPGMGKTKFAISLARHWANQVKAQGDDNVIVFASWEPNIEELVSLWAYPDTGKSVSSILGGRVPWDSVKDGIEAQHQIPILMFGRSADRLRVGAEQFGPITKNSRITPTIQDLDNACERWAKDYNIAAIFIDYTQLCADASYPNSHRDKPAAVAWTGQMLELLSFKYNTHVFALAQSGRQVDGIPWEKRYKLPEPGDIQWSSGLEQVADRMFSITAPYRSLFSQRTMDIDLGSRPGSTKRYRWQYDVKPGTYLVEMNKQRNGFPHWRGVVQMDPDSHEIIEVPGTKAAAKTPDVNLQNML